MKKALIREYVYAYAAVTPAPGQQNWMLGSKMDTPTRHVFLRQVSANHPEEFVAMVPDGAPSHRSAQLEIPDNMVLLRLKPYSPELNPAERLRDEPREKELTTKVYDSLDAAIEQPSWAYNDYLNELISSLHNAPSCLPSRCET